MRGSEEMWEAIIDNILNNFIRYAKKKIKITLKNSLGEKKGYQGNSP